MSAEIMITVGEIQFQGRLNDSPTARLISEALPIEAACNRWGEEIYFSIPVQAPLEPDAREVVEPGTLGYWPSGNAFCIFWGPTPASQGDEIRAASEVNIIGTISGNYKNLNQITNGTNITIQPLE